MVRIHPDPPTIGAVAQLGRAPALQAGGRRFDPDQLHQSVKRGQETVFVIPLRELIVAPMGCAVQRSTFDARKSGER